MCPPPRTMNWCPRDHFLGRFPWPASLWHSCSPGSVLISCSNSGCLSISGAVPTCEIDTCMDHACGETSMPTRYFLLNCNLDKWAQALVETVSGPVPSFCGDSFIGVHGKRKPCEVASAAASGLRRPFCCSSNTRVRGPTASKTSVWSLQNRQPLSLHALGT